MVQRTVFHRRIFYEPGHILVEQNSVHRAIICVCGVYCYGFEPLAVSKYGIFALSALLAERHDMLADVYLGNASAQRIISHGKCARRVQRYGYDVAHIVQGIVFHPANNNRMTGIVRRRKGKIRRIDRLSVLVLCEIALGFIV